ncbi:RsmE family RNA methyltransferase [Treponema sp. R6D11]
MKKIFVNKNQVLGEHIALDKFQINHLNALRLDNVIACDEEFDYDCVFSGDKLLVNEKNPATGELGYDLSLYICFPKGDKINKIVEQASLIGATKIVPVISEYVQVSKSIACKKIDKLKKIAIEAAGVAGRGKIPEICEPIDFREIFEKEERIILAYEKEKENKITSELVAGGSVGVVVGAEGGISAEEAEYAKEKGARIITLGKLVLKVELAAAATLAVVIHEKEK